MGTDTDANVAHLIHRDRNTVGDRRRQLCIPHQVATFREWTTSEEKLLGTMPDPDLARRLGRSLYSIRCRRAKLGIPQAERPNYRRWTKRELNLLGTRPDSEVAKLIGRRYEAVRDKRIVLAIPYLSPRYRWWSEHELRLLRKKTAEEVARLIGRSVKGVRLKCFKLGLRPLESRGG